MDIEWESRAMRQLRRIDMKDQDNVFDSVDQLRRWPNCTNVKVLVGQSGRYRLRVGRYRVIFSVADVLVVEEVRKRDERTYKASNHS